MAPVTTAGTVLPHDHLHFRVEAEQAMGMVILPQGNRWTVEAVRALPDDGNRYECVDGALLVNPAPAWRHQHLLGRLWLALGSYLENEPVAVALLAPADVPVDDLTLVQPDLFVVPLVEGRPPQEWSEAGHMLLVCEVLSPSSARHDRVVKRIKYQALGVEYWIFDLDGSRVERWLPDATLAEIVTDVLVWTAPGAREPLRIDLPLLFGRLA